MAMRLYWELSKLSFQRQITYRTATIAGLATNIFFGLLRAAVMVALFGSRSEVAGIDIAEAITYTGLAQATIAFLSLFGWYDVTQSVYTGEVGSDLLKPMDYFSFWMSRDFGRATAQLLLRGFPVMVLYAIIFGITTPQDPAQWIGLSAALTLAWGLSFAWRFFVNLSAFWTPNAVGFGRFAAALSWFFSGFLMPLRFFPEWFNTFVNLTPFPHMINTVIEVYLGLLSGPELIRALSAQAGWFLILFIAGQLVLRAGVRRLVILGG